MDETQHIYELQHYLVEVKFIGTGGRKEIYLPLLNPGREAITMVDRIVINDSESIKVIDKRLHGLKLSFRIRHDFCPTVAERNIDECKVKVYLTTQIKREK